MFVETRPLHDVVTDMHHSLNEWLHRILYEVASHGHIQVFGLAIYHCELRNLRHHLILNRESSLGLFRRVTYAGDLLRTEVEGDSLLLSEFLEQVLRDNLVDIETA